GAVHHVRVGVLLHDVELVPGVRDPYLGGHLRRRAVQQGQLSHLRRRHPGRAGQQMRPVDRVPVMGTSDDEPGNGDGDGGAGAGGGNVARLAAQALELGVDVVGVARASVVQDLQLAFYAEAQRRGYPTGGFRIPKILAGPDAMTELATWPCDTVLNGVVGSLGLAPTLAALRAGRQLALANKESLVAGRPLVRAVAKPGQIVPVDSEHSALEQCLRGGAANEVRRLILTASGGAFRGRTRAELTDVTPEQALAHPTWDMGPVVTINSATLVNKGLEVIEAHELFGIGYDAIQVMIHPQSVIHSMVEFHDGSTLAQC